MRVTEAALRARPNFRRYLAARVVSVAGTLLTAVVFPVLAYRLTGSVTWTAAVAVAQALPHVLLGPLSGWLQRRSVVLGADLAGAGVLASIPVVWLAGAFGASGTLLPWHVVAVAFVAQALFVTSDVAEDGALTTLLGDDGAEAGRAAVSGSTTLVQLMVPLLIGLAVVIAAPELLLALAAAGAVASAMLVRSMPRQLPIPHPRREAGGALRFVRSDATARTMALVGFAHAVAGGAFAAVLLPWADVELGVPPAGDARLALVVSCWAIGGLIAAGITPPLRRRLGSARLGTEALLASLASGLALLAATHWLPAVLIATVWATAYWVVVCNATEHHRTAVPAELRSRVDGCARALTHGLGFPAGAVLAGAVAGAAGPRAGLAAGLTVLTLGIALAWLPLRAAVRLQEGARR